MPGIFAALTELCGQLTAAGVPAALDAEDVQVPGAWVTARELGRPTLGGSWEATVHVWLVTADATDSQALRVLEQLLDGALEVLAVDTTGGDTIQLAATLVLPHTPGTPLPAFQITTTLDI
jgi:hypothetical protein